MRTIYEYQIDIIHGWKTISKMKFLEMYVKKYFKTKLNRNIDTYFMKSFPNTRIYNILKSYGVRIKNMVRKILVCWYLDNLLILSRPCN